MNLLVQLRGEYLSTEWKYFFSTTQHGLELDEYLTNCQRCFLLPAGRDYFKIKIVMETVPPKTDIYQGYQKRFVYLSNNKDKPQC